MKTLIRNFLSVLRRYKLATVLNVLGLSVAFAAFMIIMMQVDYDRNFDRFHKDADRIFRIEPEVFGEFLSALSRPYAEAFLHSSPYIEAGALSNPLAKMQGRGFFFSTENGGEKQFYEEDYTFVSPSFVDVFTFDMIEGDVRALDDPEKALIPQSLARKLFGDGPATGQALAGRDRKCTVGGVFRDFPRNSVVENVIYLPIPPDENLTSWNAWGYECYIRVTEPEQVGGLFENFNKNFDFSTINKASARWYSELSLRFTPLPEVHYVTDVVRDHVPKSSRQTVYILILIAFVIILIAGINYTNFSASLAPRRIRSINTQKVLGGSTAVIRAALITEGIVISLFSFLLGAWLVTLAGDTPLIHLVDADIALSAHGGLVAFTAGLAFLTGLLAGLYPSFYVTSVPPAMALKGSFGLSIAGRRLRNGLISVQFVASFLLIISASFIYLQNYYMQHAPLGYDRDEIIVININDKINESLDAFGNRMKSFAGIENVTCSQVLLSGSDLYSKWGKEYRGGSIEYGCLQVDHSFLRVMGIEVSDGRDFREDDKLSEYGVYIFNEKARSEYGLELNERLDGIEIVGFIPDVKFTSLRMAVAPMAFFVRGRNWTEPFNYAYVKVKAGSDLRAAMTHVRSTLREFDDEYPFDVRFFDEVLNRTYESEQRFGSLITIFSLIAIFISIVGVFGLVIFDSEYRRREIGIRKVFGSTTREILVVFNKTYVRILALCFVLSAPVAWYAVSRWMENFAYRTPMYWWVYLAAFAVVFVLTVATVTFQNWRAANMNPIESIKAE